MATSKTASKKEPKAATQKSASQKAASGKDEKSPAAFEESLASLEQVVVELEAGKLTLTESIERYESGVKLLKSCHKALDQVQRKIELLTGVDESGRATTVPFGDDLTTELAADKPSGRSAKQRADSGDPSVAERDVDEEGRLF